MNWRIGKGNYEPKLKTNLPAVKSLPENQFKPERWVSAEVVAVHLSIERRQVLKLTRAGLLPAHPIDPTSKRKLWRYRLSEVDAAVAQCKFAENSHVPDNSGGSPRSQRG
jgi:hypothetical protein